MNDVPWFCRTELSKTNLLTSNDSFSCEISVSLQEPLSIRSENIKATQDRSGKNGSEKEEGYEHYTLMRISEVEKRKLISSCQ